MTIPFSSPSKPGMNENEGDPMDHPLAPPTPLEDDARSPIHPSTYASLVQSAAAYAQSGVGSSASSVSDDENDDWQKSNPSLTSLPRKKVEGVPDEQDRKRFIGCLASILGCAFDYDGYDDEISMDEINRDYLDSQAPTKQPPLSRMFSQTSMNSAPSKTMPMKDLDEEEEEDGEDDFDDDRTVCTLDTTSSLTVTPRRGLSYGSSRRQRSSQFSLARKKREEIELAISLRRHRRRRYHLYVNLLLSAADYLMLDRSHAKAFIPMLEILLEASPNAQAHASTPPTPEPPTPPGPDKGEEKKDQPAPVPETPEIIETESQTKTQPSKTKTTSLIDTSLLSPSAYGLFDDSDDQSNDLFAQEDAMATGHSEKIERNSDGSNDVVERSSEVRPPGTPMEETIEPEEDAGYDLEYQTMIPFLESLTPGSGFKCVTLLLLNHLLYSETGYDARIRHIIKKVAVRIMMFDLNNEAKYIEDISKAVGRNKTNKNEDEEVRKRNLQRDLAAFATRKFEVLEHTIAQKLIQMSSPQAKHDVSSNAAAGDKGEIASRKRLTREQIVRGLKVGSAGVVAGTLFALTGGLAAPGIAAGIAAIAGSTAAATAAVASLTSTAAVTAIFGVGGGGLYAYKVNRRTQGLTEFEFQRETNEFGQSQKKSVEAELFSTICLSGWLRDMCDFQRPWGVTPTNPRILDRLELLERFYHIHRPSNIAKSARILTNWRGEERALWRTFKEKYGRTPDQLFPLSDGMRLRAKLTQEEDLSLNMIFEELGLNPAAPVETGRRPIKNKVKAAWGWTKSAGRLYRKREDINETYFNDHAEDPAEAVPKPFSQNPTPAQNTAARPATEEDEEAAPPKHLATVWDYKTSYGGEIYTVKWESRVLLELCDTVTDMAVDVVGNVSKEILKQTALSTLLTAVAIPYAMVNVSNMIDSTWTLAVERADEAGVELARSLLHSKAGQRPVNLVGFSMGARTIYSCLKELARQQELWEAHQEKVAASVLVQEAKERGEVIEEENEEEEKLSAEETVDFTREPASIVEDAILMGTPNHMSLESWRLCRQVVAGRLVNCYSRKDWILSMMFQYKRMARMWKPVCGTTAVDAAGVENFDVTEIIVNHRDYCLYVGDILKLVGHGEPLNAVKNRPHIISGEL